MSPGADRLWSAQQQAWLGALGHTLYLPADWPTEAAGQLPAASEAPAPEVSAPAPPRPASDSRVSRPARVAPAMPASRAAPPARAAGSRLPDRLHFALIRASGCNPNAPDAAEMFAQWPPSAELRGNPAAKRALWPALRRLRRAPSS